MALVYIVIEGRKVARKELLRLRREQQKARRQPTQDTLFPLHDDSRPCSQKDASGRYRQPLLFDAD